MVVEIANAYGDSLSDLGGLKHDRETGHVCRPFIPDQRHRFLVSFLVDARGGSMRGSRHPGLRILVPPNAASAPTRITCRVLRSDRAAHPPPLNDSEGLACRIIELGPYPCTFNSPVLLEIPHFASLRGRQRELVVLRSDNGTTWHEHSLEATDQAVQSALGQSFVDENLETSEELREKRIVRILMNNFPQYLAVVSRLRQEAALIGSDGGVLSSSVVPQVQAVFPEGALQKRIRVGLQAHPIPDDLVASMFGNRVAVSPIVTLEPRRRKFHKPITLTIPLPKVAYRAMQGTDSGYLNAQNVPSLRVLCSITGGTMPAQWEDLTGSTPLSKVKDCVAFTTTVSARFWLVYCPAVHESMDTATRLYYEASLVPYMCKFTVFSKRQNSDEALLRCFCISDDKVDKTLECQEGFQLCATSPEVEILHNQYAWLTSVGNLSPMTRSGEQLRLHFIAFRENRLAFPVRVKDMQQRHVGKLAFVRDPRPMSTAGSSTPGEVRSSAAATSSASPPICTLEVDLAVEQQPGDAATPTAVDSDNPLSEPLDTVAPSSFGSISCVFPSPAGKGDVTGLVNGALQTPGWPSVYANDLIARTELDLLHVAGEVGTDWHLLLPQLLPRSRLGTNCTVDQLVQWINDSEPLWQQQHHRAEGTIGSGLGGLTANELRSESDRALAVLLAWREECGEKATGNELDRALRAIGRMDVVKSCMQDIQYVVQEAEQLEATRRIDSLSETTDQQPNHQQPEPTTTSLVATDVLASGMDDPSLHWTETTPDAPVRSAEESRSPEAHSPEESRTPESTAEDSGRHQPEAELEEEWVPNGSECQPVTSTSQQGGDPMIMEGGNETVAGGQGEKDLVRDSESMTASLDERAEPEVAVPGAGDEQKTPPQQQYVEQDEHEECEVVHHLDDVNPDRGDYTDVQPSVLTADAHHSGAAFSSDTEDMEEQGRVITIRPGRTSSGEQLAGENGTHLGRASPVPGDDNTVDVDSEGLAIAHHGVELLPGEEKH